MKSSDLRTIPGVGKTTEDDLRALGYDSVASLCGADPDALYAADCTRRACVLDRCVLYVYRCAVYFATHAQPEPEKCKWWYWKDHDNVHD